MIIAKIEFGLKNINFGTEFNIGQLFSPSGKTGIRFLGDNWIEYKKNFLAPASQFGQSIAETITFVRAW